jgi:outer membrane murein-binding lipoprotein Lpp
VIDETAVDHASARPANRQRPATTVACVSRRLLLAPSVPRAVAICGLVAAALGTTALAGCSSHRQATGFCATIQRGHAEFNSLDSAHQASALAEFHRIAASAPAAVAHDLEAIATVVAKPSRVAGNTSRFLSYFAAVGRVDRYLHQSCGLTIPPTAKF